MNASHIGKTVLSLAVLGAGIASTEVGAAEIFWTDWLGTNAAPTPFTAQGTITTNTTSIGVTYSNANGVGFYQPSGGIDYYIGGSGSTSPYTSSVVDNRPTGTDIIGLRFAGTQTLSFSQTVANAAADVVGVQLVIEVAATQIDDHLAGAAAPPVTAGIAVETAEAEQFEVLVERVAVAVQTDEGEDREPHGTLRFTGAFDTVMWRSKTNEFWNGFTVGVQGSAAEVFPEEPPVVPSIPEPTTLALMTAGLGLIAAARRRLRG